MSGSSIRKLSTCTLGSHDIVPSFAQHMARCKPFVCECGADFHKKRALNRHWANAHGTEVKYCEPCEADIPMGYNGEKWKLHVKRKHGTGLTTCKKFTCSCTPVVRRTDLNTDEVPSLQKVGETSISVAPRRRFAVRTRV